MFKMRDISYLIGTEGETLQLITDAEAGTYNPDTGRLEGGTDDPEVDFVGYIYEQDLGLQQEGTTVSSTRRCVIAGNGISVVPTDKHRIKEDGVELDILKVERIKSKGTVVCYICHLVN